MENYSKLDHAILNFAQTGILNLSKINWPAHDHCYFDYQAEISINDFKVTGRGTSNIEDTAIRKAFSEAFERLVVKENQILSTNGCAAHLDLEKAKVNAIYELIERDCFLFHFHFGLTEQFQNVTIPARLINLIRHNSANVKTLQFETMGDVFSITLIRFEHGTLLGLCLDQEAETSLEKSFIEAYRQYIYFDAYPPVCKNKFEMFSSIDKYTYDDHGDLLFDSNYNVIFEEIINHRSSRVLYKFDKGKLLSKEYYSLLLPDVPLTFVKVESEQILQLYLGQPQEEILKKRLLGYENHTDKLNLIPHPIR